jgi:hypothetical protein
VVRLRYERIADPKKQEARSAGSVALFQVRLRETGRTNVLGERELSRSTAPALALHRATATASAPTVLTISDLHVHFTTPHGLVRAVEGVSYFVFPG